MGIELSKRWRPLTAEEVAKVPGQLGIFELGNDEGRVLFIGMAGGKSPFGLRSEIERHADTPTGGATQFRYEVNMQYQTRYRELLMAHQARHGALPPGNRLQRHNLGRLSPG
jgi:hypothetical protein